LWVITRLEITSIIKDGVQELNAVGIGLKDGIKRRNGSNP
jgi:hypothetical protein